MLTHNSEQVTPIFIRSFGYKVYRDGRVQNEDGSFRRHNINHKGYIQISVKVGGKWTTKHLHKWLYELFVGAVPKGCEVDHIDNDRANFSLDNLQLLTKSENNRKSYTSGNRDVSGIKNANAKLTQRQIDLIPTFLEHWTIAWVAEIYNVSHTCIRRYIK